MFLNFLVLPCRGSYEPSLPFIVKCILKQLLINNKNKREITYYINIFTQREITESTA